MATTIARKSAGAATTVDSPVATKNGPGFWYDVLSLAGLCVVLAIIGWVRWQFLETPLERDEGEFAYGGQLILAGETPYTAMYAMKLPGIYLVYALIEATFGQTTWAIHLGLMVVNQASLVLVYLSGRRLLDPAAGLIAAAAFALLTISPLVQGTQAQAEHFVVLAALAGWLLLEIARERHSPALCLSSGLALGAAVLIKQHGMFFPLFALVYFAWAERELWHRDRRGFSLEMSALVGGALLPGLICCLVFLLNGSFGAMWFWTVTYPSEYVALLPISAQFSQALSGTLEQLQRCGILWGAAAIGFSALWWFRPPRQVRAFVLLFLAASLLAIMPGGYYRQHYYVYLAAPLALLTGIGLRALVAEYRAAGGGRVMPIVLVIIIFAWPIISLAQFYAPLTPQLLSRKLYGGNPFVEAEQLSRFLSQHTEPEDRIGILGSEPEIFFLTQRRSATGHIYMYPLTEPVPSAAKLQQQVVQEMTAARPKYVLQVLHPTSWLNRTGGDLKQFNTQIEAWLRADYHRIGVVEQLDFNETRYLWGPPARRVKVTAIRSILVHERRDTAKPSGY